MRRVASIAGISPWPAFVSIRYLTASWWPHLGMHRVAGLDPVLLLYVDYGFHLPYIVADELHGLWELILNATLFSIGHILLGIATFRAGTLPRAAAALVVVGAPLLAFAPPIPVDAVLYVGTAAYSTGLFWLGYAVLMTDRGEHVTLVHPARPIGQHASQ